MTEELIEHIRLMDFASFEREWAMMKNKMTETEKQNLLTEILSGEYRDKDFKFYKKVFDKIIDSKVSLDFNIDRFAPTFLSLAVDRASRKMFDYLIKKGANLNFIGDSYASTDEDTIRKEVGENLSYRYSTCLDFANTKLADLLTTDYHYWVPEKSEKDLSCEDIDEKEEITIRKQIYYYLIEQAEYLQELIFTDRLVDHIISSGGKTYEELRKKKE